MYSAKKPQMSTARKVAHTRAWILSNLIIEEWLASYSDNGQLWEKARAELVEESKNYSPKVLAEAREIAQARWKKMIK